MTTSNNTTEPSTEDRPANDTASPDWVERADELTGDGPPPAEDPMVEHYRDK